MACGLIAMFTTAERGEVTCDNHWWEMVSKEQTNYVCYYSISLYMYSVKSATWDGWWFLILLFTFDDVSFCKVKYFYIHFYYLKLQWVGRLIKFKSYETTSLTTLALKSVLFTVAKELCSDWFIILHTNVFHLLTFYWWQYKIAIYIFCFIMAIMTWRHNTRCIVTS